jgi:hypothetical protein
MVKHLIEMIAAQRAFQEHLGHKFENMSVNERCLYIQQMWTAAIKELGEALDEVSWKTWTTHNGLYINADALTAELSDAFQFMMNMWFAAFPHAEPEELAARMYGVLMDKLAINRARQDNGYDGKSTKCGGCGRALDDPAVACSRRGGQGWCSRDGADINYITTT